MQCFHVFPYISTLTARSIQRVWGEFCTNPTEEVKETLCNKIRHYFMQTPMMAPDGHHLLNSLSNNDLLNNCYYEVVIAPGLPDQDTLVFETSKAKIRVWCSLKSFMNKSIYGEILGYPTCCVTYFNNSSQAALKPIYNTRDKKLAEIGFIPCPTCIKRPADDVINGIIRRRHFNNHFENGEHFITALANQAMVDAYGDGVERPSNSYYGFQKWYPGIELVGIVDQLLKHLKISKITV